MTNINNGTGNVLNRVAILVNHLQQELNAHYEEHLPHLVPPQVGVDIGDAFVRIYHHNITTDGIWAVCFVMRDTGNIRMPLGLKAFDRYNVGSVMEEDGGLSMVTTDGLIRAPADVPSSYDPAFKKKSPVIITKKPSVQRNSKLPDDFDMSPEAEARRQREYGRQMHDDSDDDDFSN